MALSGGPASRFCVRSRGVAEIRRRSGGAEADAFDPEVWSGRAWQEVSSMCRHCGLASMYPAFAWSVAPGHHGYQRACGLISGQASNRPSGSPGFARAGRPDLHLVLSSRRPRRESGITSSASPHQCSSFVRAVGRSFIPACPSEGAAHRGGQGWPPSAATRLAWP